MAPLCGPLLSLSGAARTRAFRALHLEATAQAWKDVEVFMSLKELAQSTNVSEYRIPTLDPNLPVTLPIFQLRGDVGRRLCNKPLVIFSNKLLVGGPPGAARPRPQAS